MKSKRLDRTTIYQSPWLNVYTDKVRFPSGVVSDEYHILDFEIEAVAVLVENKAGQLLLIQSYPYPTNSTGWEVPAGQMEPGESIIEAAKREVWEVTGYETAAHKHIYTYNPMLSDSNKVYHIVEAQSTMVTGDFDRDEVEAMQWFSKSDIQHMIDNQTIQDGFSLTALLMYLNRCK